MHDGHHQTTVTRRPIRPSPTTVTEMNKLLSRGFGAAAAAALLMSSSGGAFAAPLAQQPKGAPHADAVGGPSGVSGWAVINSDGTIARKLNAISADRISTGSYEVIFNSKITKCAYTATTGDPGSTATPGPMFIGITGRDSNARGVFVATYDQSGASADTPFFVNVAC